jgi:uncharacterized protein YndB with AHSA1/START domain
MGQEVARRGGLIMFTIEIEIDRPPEVVFGYLAQVENTPKWYSAVEKADKLTSAPVSTGTCYCLLRRLPTRHAINDVEVTEFVPNIVFTLASRSGPSPFTYRYRLSPHGNNTHLRLEGEIGGEGLGPGFALLAPLASRLFERGMRANLATLKQLLELA